MKKQIYTVLALALCLGAFAQDKPGVGINTKRVDKSAILEVVAEKKGVLIPRISINDVAVFGLDGDSKKESMLVYNEKGTAAKGFYYWTNIDATKGKWELITSESVLNQKIEELKNYVDTEIQKITNIGDPTNLSYLVA
ncbi:calcium-binding protein, partial [Myroides odoratimimus]|nr:calcium-binding protein [Myroides odoratimimus]